MPFHHPRHSGQKWEFTDKSSIKMTYGHKMFHVEHSRKCSRTSPNVH
jgi:hypothetical protein